MTAILALASIAMWPLGGLRKPKAASHCTYCDYDSARQQAGPCSECGKLTGVPSRSRRGRVAWRLRWVLPAIIAGGWFTIETRYQGHAWWLLPNWAVIALHDAVGPNASETLRSEYLAALNERASNASGIGEVLEALQIPSPIRQVWPEGIEPLNPNPSLLENACRVWTNRQDSWFAVEVNPVTFDELTGTSDSWNRWHRASSPLFLTQDKRESESFVRVSTASQARRSLFNLFDPPTLQWNFEGTLTVRHSRCASIDELLTPIEGPEADQAVRQFVKLRLIDISGQWGLYGLPGTIDPRLANTTLGLRLAIDREGKTMGECRFVVRLGPAGSSTTYGLKTLSPIPVTWTDKDVDPRSILDDPRVRFMLHADEGMALTDPIATTFWRGSIEVAASDVLRPASTTNFIPSTLTPPNFTPPPFTPPSPREVGAPAR